MVVAVVVIVVGVLIWHAFSSSGTGTGTTPTGTGGTLPSVGTQTGSGSTGTGGTLPSGSGTATTGIPSGGSVFGVISDEPTLNYFVDSQNNVTIVEPNGEIATIANGQPTFLSSTQIAGVLGAAFSYDGKKVFVNFGDPTNPQTSVFDTTTKAWTPLPEGIISPAWSPTDYRIAYLSKGASGAATVSTLDVSKTTNKPVALVTLDAADLTLTWPNKTTVILSGKGSAYAQSTAWLFALSSKTLTEVVPDSFGFESTWSATTSTTGLVLSSLTYGRTGSLSIVPTAPSAVTQALTLATLPSKCVFSYQTPTSTQGTVSASSTTSSTTPTASTPYLALYCGIPTNSSFAAATLPDDYDQMAIFTTDSFYMINTATGQSQTVFAPSVSVDATNLNVFNNILFFVNRYDNKLYAISLSGE